MSDREKIINIVQSVKYCDVNNRCLECKYDKELYNYKDTEIGCGTLRTADALLSNNIGEIGKWKEKAEKEKAEKNKWKCTANDWKQRFVSKEKQLRELQTTNCEVLQKKDKVYREQKTEIDRLSIELKNYKSRAENAEERLRKLKKTEGSLTIEEEINTLEALLLEARHRAFVFENKIVKEREELRDWKKRAEAAEIKLLRISDIIRNAVWDAYCLGQNVSHVQKIGKTTDILEGIIEKASQKIKSKNEEEE